jgi:hypothetical protein
VLLDDWTSFRSLQLSYTFFINPLQVNEGIGKKKPAISNGFCSSPDGAGLCNGGGAGNRTPDTTDMSRML